MSTDPRRITPDESLSELFKRVRALERRSTRLGSTIQTAFGYGISVQLVSTGVFKYIDLGNFELNGSPAFGTDTVVIGGTTYTGINLLEEGSYMVFASGSTSAGGTPFQPGDNVNLYYDGDGAGGAVGDPFGMFQGSDVWEVPASWTAGQLFPISFLEVIAVKATDVPPPTLPMIFKARNNTAGRGVITYKVEIVFVPGQYPFAGL